jgi:hypothetical protein
MSAAAWDDPAGRIRELEAEVHQLRAGVEALADGDLWEHADALRALLAGGAR